jgi:hypothetical protein
VAEAADSVHPSFSKDHAQEFIRRHGVAVRAIGEWGAKSFRGGGWL